MKRPRRAAPPQIFSANLWELLQTGDLQQDVVLRDGDTILIPTASNLSPEEATQLATANFSPDEMQVNVIGEVKSPGAIQVPPNTPLNQALLAAGGFTRKARKKSVTLIRLNPNGTVTQSAIAVDLAQGIDSQTNPTLQHNDAIIVGRSGSAKFSDGLGSFLGTVGKLLPFGFLF